MQIARSKTRAAAAKGSKRYRKVGLADCGKRYRKVELADCGNDFSNML